MTEKGLTYRDAGVDLDKAVRIIDPIKQLAESTRVPGVVGEIGGFGGLFSLERAGAGEGTLVSSTDGVGTKLKIAFMMGKHGTVGIDLVAMCVNDILAQGAKPLFFLDYLATGVINEKDLYEIVSGIAEGCRQSGCALIGGETAELPGFYSPGEYDLAGFAVGILLDNFVKDKADIGDALYGIASSGLHSNGYSLVRKICFERLKLDVDTEIAEFGRCLGEELLEPTRIYTDLVMGLQKNYVRPISIANITGGGIPDNLSRILSDNAKAILKKGSWEVPPIFNFLQKGGRVEEAEMLRTFNNGLGLIIAVPRNTNRQFIEVMDRMGEKYWHIGGVTERVGSEDQIEWVS